MKETDSKKQRNEDFTRQHTITEQEFKTLIAEKIERAKFYSLSFKERESRAKLADQYCNVVMGNEVPAIHGKQQ